jgi:hypothetical protein
MHVVPALIAAAALPAIAPVAGLARRAAAHASRRPVHHRRHARPRPAHRSRAASTAPARAATAQATVDQLRFGYTVPQLDALFGSLPAGPMPGNVTARGWVRVRLAGFENRQGNLLLNDSLVPLLWKGQVWQTNQKGGTLINRTLNDTRRDFPAVVEYGQAFFDSRPAIEVTYPTSTNPQVVDRLYLDCRAVPIGTVQTGVYLCYVWLEPPGSEQKVLLFNVIENTLDPN